MADRDPAGQRKVRLMSVWVGVGIAFMVLGVFTTLWVSFLGAGIIGSTPVFFTLRSALVDRQLPKATSERSADPLAPRVGRSPAARRRMPARRRGHDW